MTNSGGTFDMSIPQKIIQESLPISNIPFKNDKNVYIDEYAGSVTLTQVMQLIFGERLTLFPKKSHERNHVVSGNLAPGWVHLGRDKKDLTEQRTTNFVRTYSTFLNYVAKGYEYMTFGTFNTKTRRSFDRKRQNLNSVRVFVIDIDSKKWSVQDILRYCSNEGILPPSFINETPRGFHLWYALLEDMIGPHVKDDELTRVGAYYNDINRFLIEKFEKAFPASEGGTDALVGGERYIRIPTNLVYYNGNQYLIRDFVQIRKELNLLEPRKEKITKQKTLSHTYIPMKALQEDPAYHKLLTMQPNYGQRRYTAFSIALLFKSINKSVEDTTEWLQSWFDQLDDQTDFTWREVNNSIQCAYKNKFKGVSPKWVYKLTGLQPKLFFTRRLTEEERKNKTLNHWEAVFLQYIKACGGVASLSNRELCDIIGLSSRAMLDTFVASLIEKGEIRKEVVGKGRHATTSYFLMPKEPIKRDKEKIILLSEYKEKKAMQSFFNDPHSYMTLKKFNREGGRESISISDLDDPGG